MSLALYNCVLDMIIINLAPACLMDSYKHMNNEAAFNNISP